MFFQDLYEIRAPNECPAIHLTVAITLFFLSPRGGHGRRKILMDSHPYSSETSIFTLGSSHEEVQGRQTKLHPGFTLGEVPELVQPSQGIHGSYKRKLMEFKAFQGFSWPNIPIFHVLPRKRSRESCLKP